MTSSFLRLNGIEVPVFHVGASAAKTPIGSFRRSVNGTGTVPRRTQKGSWRFDTSPRSAAVALAFRELVAGSGQVLNFDAQTYYTSTGQAPNSVAGGWSFTTTGPKYGAACAQWTTGNALWALFASGSPWTLCYWLNVSAGGYHHVIQSSAGVLALDGVTSGYALPPGWGSINEGFGGVSGGVATFGSSTASKIDDVVALPYLIPSDWCSQIYAFGSGFSALPTLTADGKFIEQDTAITVIGGDDAIARVIPVPGVKNMHSFSFELLER